MLATTRSGRPAGQQQAELDWFLAAIAARGVTRYLEVGVRFGDTFAAVAEVLPPRSLMVAVDWPGQAWGRRHSELDLQQNADYARSLGHEVHVILGNSRDPLLIEQVTRLGPFHLGFIDGDHTLSGVTHDVAHYGPMCEAIALHDISQMAPAKVEVPILWQALRAVAPVTACVAPGSGMGIGIVECAR